MEEENTIDYLAEHNPDFRLIQRKRLGPQISLQIVLAEFHDDMNFKNWHILHLMHFENPDNVIVD